MIYPLDMPPQPLNPLPDPPSSYLVQQPADYTFSSAVESKFGELATEWKRETGMLSVTHLKMIHPRYLEIIGMSWSVVPYLIRDIQEGASHWFPALRAIARETKPDDQHTTSFDEAVSIWTKWWNDRRNATSHSFPARISFPKPA